MKENTNANLPVYVRVNSEVAQTPPPVYEILTTPQLTLFKVNNRDTKKGVKLVLD